MKRSALVIALASALAMLVAATAAFGSGTNGKVLYRYTGKLTAKSSSSVSVTVENGNRPALRSLLGKSQDETFATGSKTVFLRWSHGIPTKVTVDDLAVGDYVTVNVRAERGASFETVAGKPAGIIGDHGTTLAKPTRPLYLFRGTFVSTGGGKVTIDVKGGNRRALRTMIGQTSTQSFSFSDDTVFLKWDHRVPTVIDASQLVAGDQIVVRIRANGGLSLGNVESTPAKRIADREPKAQEENQNAQS
jgi:hypothetical protein